MARQASTSHLKRCVHDASHVALRYRGECRLIQNVDLAEVYIRLSNPRSVASKDRLILLPCSDLARQAVPGGTRAVLQLGNKTAFNKLEQLSQRSGVSRGQAFEDWLTAMLCALAAEIKEDEYLAMIERHKRG